MDEIINKDKVENMIYEIRGKQVMLDSDLAKLYECKNGTKEINQAVRNNADKFPSRFSWKLSNKDVTNLRSKVLTTNSISSMSRSVPRVFTEQGVAMLATILKTKKATEVSIRIMDAFVAMRKYISNNLIEQKYINELVLKDNKRIDLLEETFNSFREKNNHIFFEGQIYDAYSLLIDILNKSKKEIIIIDNYAGKELLDILKNINKKITIVSKNITKELINKYSKQYNNICFINNDSFHDRFIILDKEIIYHCGSSFKDIGKKCFAINLIEDIEILNNIMNSLYNNADDKKNTYVLEKNVKMIDSLFLFFNLGYNKVTGGIMKLTSDVVNNIVKIKNEDKWMQDFRLKSLSCFLNSKNPSFGPKLDIDYDSITYYKERVNELTNNWNNIDKNVKNIFDDLGVISAEKKYLDGIGAQYDSEVIYHNMIKELEEKNVIFLDTDSAYKKYPELFKKYFNTLVKYDENKFTALNGAVWSGGTFIYVPPHTKLERPLQSYFRINSKNMGQFERTLIIVDEDSELHYIEGCTAPTYTEDALHAAVVEIFVGKNAKCRYTTIQNWSNDVYNLVTKRAIVEENGLMEWIDGNIGSKVNMKYPCCILNGTYARGSCISIAASSNNQIQDAGAKMIHLAPYTKSNIVSKSIASNGGNATYRGTVRISKKAINSIANVKCDTIILDDISKSDTIPKNIVENESSILEHEATVSKIGEDKLFYLMTRGISEDVAKELIILGFVSAFREELPMEYAVELNRLLATNIGGIE